MRLPSSSSSTLSLLLTTLPILTSAFPLQAAQYNRRQTASYSVVPVDGGSTSAGALATTVTAPASTRIEISTFLSTIVVTQAPSASTIVVTITSTSPATTIIESPPSAAAVTGFPSSGSFSVVTVTATPSSAPFDNGLWHTTYFHGPGVVATPTTAAAPTATAVAAADLFPSPPPTYNSPPIYNTTSPTFFNNTNTPSSWNNTLGGSNWTAPYPTTNWTIPDTSNFTTPVNCTSTVIPMKRSVVRAEVAEMIAKR